MDYELRQRKVHGLTDRGEFPVTYIVVEFSSNIKRETAQWIVDKIRMERKDGGAELLVRAQPPLDNQNLTIHVSADMTKLLELAEEIELRKRDRLGFLREFTVDEISEFTVSKNEDDLLTLAEKQSIVRHELENIRALANETYIPGYPSVTLYEGQSILANCLHCGIVKQIYPLHDKKDVKELGKNWYMSLYSPQPYEAIRIYFGESIALYFQFLGYYTFALVGPMILGFIQIFFPTQTLAFFCIFNIVAASLFLEFWRRRCAELAYSWGTITMTSLDEPRPNFSGVIGKDCVTDRLLPQYPRWKTYAKVLPFILMMKCIPRGVYPSKLAMYCISLPLVILCLIGAFFVMLFSFWVEDYIKKIPDHPTWLLYLPSTVYAIFIYLMNIVYRMFANFLTEWENHRTQSQFDRHRVTKLVLFEFVNNFMSLFYIAFILNDMDMLRSQLATLLIVLQALNNIQEAILPLVIQDYSKKLANLSYKMKAFFGNKKVDKKHAEKLELLPDVPQLDQNDPRIIQAIEEGAKDVYDDPYDDYLELFVQFGYVFLFSSIYPMAAFWAVFNNFLEIRSDAFKLCCVYQRPMARKVKDTGAWQRSFQMLCTIAVVTNCFLLYLTPSVVPDVEPDKRLMYFMILEHCLLLLKQILHFAIPDKPERVRVALARENYMSKKALKNQGYCSICDLQFQRALKSRAKGRLNSFGSSDINLSLLDSAASKGEHQI